MCIRDRSCTESNIAVLFSRYPEPAIYITSCSFVIILSYQNIFKTPIRLIFLRPALILFDYGTNSPELYDRDANSRRCVLYLVFCMKKQSLPAKISADIFCSADSAVSVCALCSYGSGDGSRPGRLYHFPDVPWGSIFNSSTRLFISSLPKILLICFFSVFLDMERISQISSSVEPRLHSSMTSTSLSVRLYRFFSFLRKTNLINKIKVL